MKKNFRLVASDKDIYFIISVSKFQRISLNTLVCLSFPHDYAYYK